MSLSLGSKVRKPLVPVPRHNQAFLSWRELFLLVESGKIEDCKCHSHDNNTRKDRSNACCLQFELAVGGFPERQYALSLGVVICLTKSRFACFWMQFDCILNLVHDGTAFVVLTLESRQLPLRLSLYFQPMFQSKVWRTFTSLLVHSVLSRDRSCGLSPKNQIFEQFQHSGTISRLFKR